MAKRLKIFLGILSTALMFGLWFLVVNGWRWHIYVLPPSSKTYGKIALQHMAEQDLYAGTEEWEEVEQTVRNQLETSKSYQESRELLKPALKLAGGKHSYFLTEADLAASSQDSQEPTSQVLEGGIL